MAETIGEYDMGQSCLNGHAITGSAGRYPEFTSKFCKDCGEATITECPKCKAPIRGNYTQGYGTETWLPPNFCRECGESFPWTDRRKTALEEAIDELDQLPAADREKLKQSIPDVIQDTPKTQTAASRFTKAIKSAGQWGGKLLTEVVTNVATCCRIELDGLETLERGSPHQRNAVRAERAVAEAAIADCVVARF